MLQPCPRAVCLAAFCALIAAGCTLGKDTGDILLASEEPDHTVLGGTIEIVAPTNGVYVTDSVTFEVTTTASPERIELERDGEPFAVFARNSTKYPWNVQSDPQGTYDVQAVAIGEDGTIRSEPVRLIVDHTPPVIAARSPEPGASGVDVAAPIWIEFEEPLDPESVGTNTVVFANEGLNAVIIMIPDQEIPSDVSLSDDGTRISVTPTRAFSGPGTFKLTVSGVTDLAGNALSEQSWTWRAGSWVQAVAPPEDLRKPKLAIDGELIYVLGERGDRSFAVLTNEEGQWVELASYAIEATPPVKPIEFVLAKDALSAWALLQTPDAYELIGFDLESGTASVVRTFETDTRPGIAIDDRGAVWLAHDQGRGAITVESWDEVVSAWSVVIAEEPTDDPTDVHLSGRDRLSLVATATRTGVTTFWEFEKTSWTQMGTRVNPDSTTALAAEGEPTGSRVVTVEDDAGDTNIQVRVHDDTGPWTALLSDDPTLHGAERVNLYSGSDIHEVDLTVQGDGDVWLTFEEYEAARPEPVSRVHVRLWTDNRWSAKTGELGMSPDDPTWTTSPDLVLRAIDDPIVAYELNGQIELVERNRFQP